MTQEAKGQKGAGRRPVHVVRYGVIRAAVWENPTSTGGVMHNVTVSRSYKDGEEWKESGSFGADDLLVLAKAVNEAHSWIFAQKSSRGEQGAS